MSELFNIEAEQAVLGAILLDPYCFDEVKGKIDAHDFCRRAHQIIFETIQKMIESGDPLDLIALTAELNDKGKLKEIGDVPYLNLLINSIPTAQNIEYYAEKVREKAWLRRLSQAGLKISDLAKNTNDAQEALSQAENIIVKITDESLSGDNDTIKSVDDWMISVSERVEERRLNPGKITGVESGFADLDKITLGFQKSHLCILAARPSMGKTAFALNVAANAAIRKEKSVAFFSLEMSGEELMDRLICSEGNIDSYAYRTGRMTDEEYQNYAQVLALLSNKKLFIDDKPNISISEMKAKCRKIKRHHDLDLVVIDYLQLIQSDEQKNNRTDEISSISRALKIMAKELDIPVIALSQLSRACEQRHDKRPILSDLRESGAIEQDADVVMFLYRDDYYNEESELQNIAELIIRKQRQGSIGTVPFLFAKRYSKFLTIDKKEWQMLKEELEKAQV
ncbi:replicative DNA helicase [Thermoactinomyces vulgaris]|uniref:replicative DNA helicase n=1 Tax=Thermoactinomyces vulgaris TaxID=2026 RepID=UPI00363F0C38